MRLGLVSMWAQFKYWCRGPLPTHRARLVRTCGWVTATCLFIICSGVVACTWYDMPQVHTWATFLPLHLPYRDPFVFLLSLFIHQALESIFERESAFPHLLLTIWPSIPCLFWLSVIVLHYSHCLDHPDSILLMSLLVSFLSCNFLGSFLFLGFALACA